MMAVSLTNGFFLHSGKSIDKWEQYLGIYERELARYVREGRPIALLEIGVQNGGSLELWGSYLPPGSTIVGLDIDPKVSDLVFKDVNVQTFVVDVTDAGAVERLLGDRTFDVIIDDGSHRSTDIIATVRTLFDRVRPGGLFVVEDLHCSYFPTHQGGFRQPGTSVEWLKRLVDAVNYDHIDRDSVDAAELAWLSEMNRCVAGISFYDSMAVIEKFCIKKQQPFRRLLSGQNDKVVRNANWIYQYSRESVRSMLLGVAAARSISEDLLELIEATRRENAQLKTQIGEAAAQKDAAVQATAHLSQAEATRHRAEIERWAERFRAEETRWRVERDALAERLRDSGERLRDSEDRLRDVSAARDRLTSDLALALRRLTAKTQDAETVSGLLDEAGIAPAASLPERVRALASRQDRVIAGLEDVWHFAQRDDIRVSALTASLDITQRRLSRTLGIVDELRSRVLDLSRSRAARAGRWLRRAARRGGSGDGADLSRVDSAIAALRGLDDVDLQAFADRGALDTAAYLRDNPDLTQAGVDAVRHYFGEGSAEARRPHPRFDAEWYVAQNLDVAAAGFNPLVHYAFHGASENRPTMPGGEAEGNAAILVLRLSGLFDDAYYRARYPECLAPDDDALIHFVDVGAALGHDPSATFGTAAYRQDHPDVAAAGTNPLLHYVLYGRAEGRVVRASPESRGDAATEAQEPPEAGLIRGSGLFDPDWYASRYLDVPPDVEGAWRHFVDHGRIEGREPNAGFDPIRYAALYPDIGGISEALLHYIRHGAAEGRSPSESFDPAWYADTYPDVGSAGAALAHYVRQGRAAGRLTQKIRHADVAIDTTQAFSLFDANWYTRRYPDVPREPEAAWHHFLHHGWTEKRQPNPLFDPQWYEQTYTDVADARLDPLKHFLDHGAGEGRAPSADFDTAWYRLQDPGLLASGENPLAHYLRQGRAQALPTQNPDAIYRNAVIDETQNLLVEHGQIARHVSLMLVRPRFFVLVEGEDEAAAQVTRASIDRQLYPAHRTLRASDLASLADQPTTDLDFLIWLHAGDVLSARALYEYASSINADPSIDLAYADEDVVRPAGRCQPFYKPGWSPDTLETFNYIGSGACFRITLAKLVLPVCKGLYDFVLRFTEYTQVVRHIRQTLCHRARSATDETSPEQTRQDIAALEGRLSRTGRVGRVSAVVPGRACLDVRITRRAEPMVSIVMPTAGKTVEIGGRRVDLLVNSLSKICQRSTYKHMEIIVVDNGDLNDRQIRHLQKRDVHRVTYTHPVFNVAKKLNMGAAQARGELLLLLNDDVEPLNADWIERLAEHFEKPHVGVVGAKLLYHDMLTQHVGVVTNQGRPDHVRRLRPRDEQGYFFSSCGTRNYLAVTGACMMTPKTLFHKVGGYSEDLAVSYNDVDYCLKLQEIRRSSVYAPRAELIHFESRSRVATLDPAEEAYFFRRWAEPTTFDPFYNEEGLSSAPPTFEVRANRGLIG